MYVFTHMANKADSDSDVRTEAAVSEVDISKPGQIKPKLPPLFRVFVIWVNQIKQQKHFNNLKFKLKTFKRKCFSLITWHAQPEVI